MNPAPVGSLHDFINQHVPHPEDVALLSGDKLDELRKKYIEKLLQEELGELTDVENSVIKNIGSGKILTSALHLKKGKSRQAVRDWQTGWLLSAAAGNSY